jgi:protease-4
VHPDTLHNMTDEFDPTPAAPDPIHQPPPPPHAAPPVYAYPPNPFPPNPYANAYVARPRRGAGFWLAIIAGTCACFGLLIWGTVYSAAHAFSDNASTTSGSGKDKIAVIDLDGVIMDAEKIDTQLRKFGNDANVKAIILHINSPGGGAAASQEIYHEVVRVRQEKHKKIIASVESVGASGAYYIASGCDKIYANDASVVGSIGVIMEWTNYGDLMKWAKLKSVVVHAGELKDAGDPTHDMTPKEEAYFQSLVDNMYGQFVHDVADGRHSTEDKIRPLATGQVWTGQQSLGLGLIDKVGGFRVALMDTAKDVGISGEPSLVRPATAKKGLQAFINGEGDDLFPNPTKLLDHAPGFYFMWK